MMALKDVPPMPPTLHPPSLPATIPALPPSLRKAPRSRPRPTPTAAPYLGGIAFAAGRSVPELLRHLDAAQLQARADGDAALAQELADRSALLRGLLAPKQLASLLQPPAAPQQAQSTRFGHWLTRLQAAWYAGQPVAAMEAVDAATALAGPHTPAGDLLLFHAFAVSARAWWQATAPSTVLMRHCDAVRQLDQRCQASGGALHMLALAACALAHGDALGALRGFEQAAGKAARLGLHWLAALAYEQAAMHANKLGIGMAAFQYREQCLTHYRYWGAAGQVRDLQRSQDAEEENGAGAGPFASDSRFDLALAHELNQPLAAICLHAVAAGKWLSRAAPDIEQALESLALIDAAGRQAGGIVHGLQRLAADQPAERAAVDVNEVVRATVLQLRHRLCDHRIEIDVDAAIAGGSVTANRVQLQQVLTNLLVNAIEAHAGSALAGKKRIRIQWRHIDDRWLELSVGDNGPGIAPCDHGRVFNTRFSTKRGANREASGMGLSICLSIVRAHGGQAWFEPCEPHGACFRVRLPR